MNDVPSRAEPMYSLHWFDAFAPAVASTASLEIAAISALCALPEFSRLLEIGCGSGRIASPLASIGYDVVGLDISGDALREAELRAPGPKYVALDQRHVGRMPWMSDGVLVLWNSIGFGDASRR